MDKDVVFLFLIMEIGHEPTQFPLFSTKPLLQATHTFEGEQVRQFGTLHWTAWCMDGKYEVSTNQNRAKYINFLNIESI